MNRFAKTTLIAFTLSLTLLGTTALPHPTPAAHAAIRVADEERHFKIDFDYSGVDESLFTDEVKRQIESGARLIETFIANDGEITIKVAVGKAAGALATGAPGIPVENTEERSIFKTGSIEFGTRFVEQARDGARDGKGDISALTMHEILHCLGFTERSKAIAKNLAGKQRNGTYTGPYSGENAMRFNNGQPVPFDGAHFRRGFKDKNNIAPRMWDGGGNTMSIFDLAVLADLGYDVPQIKDHTTPDLHFPKEYYTEDTYQGKKVRYVSGEAGNDVLRAYDYDRDGEKGGYQLVGGGGDDVLISGPGNDILDGENATAIPNGGPMGKPGKNTFVIPANSGKDKIMGYRPGVDVIYLSPEIGVDSEKLEAAIKAAKQEVVNPATGSFRPGNWVLKIGDFELLVSTGTTAKKPSVSDFKIEDWKAE